MNEQEYTELIKADVTDEALQKKLFSVYEKAHKDTLASEGWIPQERFSQVNEAKKASDKQQSSQWHKWSHKASVRPS